MVVAASSLLQQKYCTYIQFWSLYIMESTSYHSGGLQTLDIMV